MDTSKKGKGRAKTVVAAILAILVAMLGAVLFVAGKTGAGINIFIAAVLIALPLGWFAGKHRWLGWVRVALVVLLFVVAIINIANTDIPPDADITGLKFVDQLLAIWGRFADTVFGG